MSKAVKRNISITGPQTFSENVEIKEPMAYAGGSPSVQQALRHTFKEMGAVKGLKGLLKMNQKNGFDCPSCAWPDPEKPKPGAEYCENGAKALADEATTENVGADFFKKHSVEELSLLSDYELNKHGRLTEPLVLNVESKHYETISWDNAYQLIASELRKINSPDEAIFYTSGRSSNEAAFLYGMFARALGTNNMPDCSNMCHESSGVALSETLGIGKGSVKLEDFYDAEVVIIAGQNPGTNHPRMLSALEKCKKNGGKIISINPLKEAGLVSFKNPQKVKGWLGNAVALADIHLQVNINQDIALVKLLLKKLLRLDEESNGGVFDHRFIEQYTEGYQKLAADLEQYDEEQLLEQSGVDESLVKTTTALLAKKSKIIICWAMGLTQHKNGVENIREFVNLLLLKGAIGKPNAGTCPVRGHSNVQGDRSVGIHHYVNNTLNEKIEAHFGFKAPTKQGYDTVESIHAMHEGNAKVFICLGGNFLMAASDTEYTAEAIQNCELTVQISTKLNRSHLVTGKTALILPTLGRSEKDQQNGKEQFITTENSMGKVRWSKGFLKPTYGNLKSEPEIIAEIANTYFNGNHSVPWEKLGSDYSMIREYIDKIAKGFDETEKRSKGTGYYLPNNARELDFSNLPNGKAQITINQLPEHDLKSDELMLMTIRSHDQFNTTIYGMDDRYRGVYNERRVLFMNEMDMKSKGLDKMDVVHIRSNYDNIERKAFNFLVIPYDIPKGNMAAYYPETNVLVPYNHFADRSQTPISKSIKVSIEKVEV
ncbi:FdhF/YdeP family oxidoreductase [Flagellimonas allohymeniacidonis]|uniref:FdhF/YdeP family oxidoreductase n=1 Tax=Flagellimonas allohymeniacidonis TaxID=2517819 RepID=A0A4Q8QGE5_9FLAO|nr:FdhF/YdeP family oxidoreductase [Allomuricauda hymeniacidonis]TAI47186.1 FdhF/YdeP family oxidoreductase [Allomuricauda hymeniacidonis]